MNLHTVVTGNCEPHRLPIHEMTVVFMSVPTQKPSFSWSTVDAVHLDASADALPKKKLPKRVSVVSLEMLPAKPSKTLVIN